MEVEIVHGPGNSAARVQLKPDEVVTAEGGAMISMSGDMDVKTTTHKKGKGGLLKAAKRLLAGESFFINHFTASSKGGEVLFASTLPGDMLFRDLEDENLIVQGGSWVCSEPGIEIDLGPACPNDLAYP